MDPLIEWWSKGWEWLCIWTLGSVSDCVLWRQAKVKTSPIICPLRRFDRWVEWKHPDFQLKARLDRRSKTQRPLPKLTNCTTVIPRLRNLSEACKSKPVEDNRNRWGETKVRSWRVFIRLKDGLIWAFRSSLVTLEAIIACFELHDLWCWSSSLVNHESVRNECFKFDRFTTHYNGELLL